jgi:single-stranded DNA-binding protein
MSAHALITGTLFRAPEQRTAKSGRQFVAATLKAKDGEATKWWKVLAFSETARAELMRLADGDAMCVQGQLRVETYQAESGETKMSLSIIANAVLALREPAKKEKPPQEAKALKPAPRDVQPVFDDAIPF